MPVTRPRSLDEVLAVLEADPDAQVLAGGTDLMVDVNFGHRRPSSIVALGGVPELRGWRREGDTLVLGAGLTYSEMERPDLAALVPALAQAARTVGSPQIRNAGTLGGNLGTASPAGDTLPVLAALDATVILRSRSSTRRVPVLEFVTGVKRTALQAGELVIEVRVPVLRGSQEFLKVGTRNAMVIAIASVALVLDLDGHSIRCGLGSVSAVPLRATEAEVWIADRIDWTSGRLHEAGDALRFGELVAAAARPIDDHRATAAYRRHAVGVCARRALERVAA